MLNRGMQLLHVAHPFVLRDFHHQHAWRHAAAASSLDQRLGFLQTHGLDQGVSADVDEQPAGLARLAPLEQCGAHAEQLKLKQQVFLMGQGQQHVRALPFGPGRTTDQRFMTEDRAASEIGNGLEHAVQCLRLHQGGQPTGCQAQAMFRRHHPGAGQGFECRSVQGHS